MAGGVLFVEDELEVLAPILRRLRRKQVASAVKDYEDAKTALRQINFNQVVFDQLFPNGQLGTTLFESLRRGDFGQRNMRAQCAFYTELTPDEVLREIPEGLQGPDVPVIMKVQGPDPLLYEFLGVADPPPDEHSRWRTLIEVVGVVDGNRLEVLVPGWRSEERVRLPMRRLPPAIARELRVGRIAGRMYTAMANLGAEDADGLALDEFDILKEA